MRDTLIFTEGDQFVWPFDKERVKFYVKAGLSNRGADLDNILKPLLDTYQNMYEDFNDNRVYLIEAYKDIVPKGQEYLEVTIDYYNNTKDDIHCGLSSGSGVQEQTG